jgi:two-component system cell cycle sensor histidine kinase/response regulator CckA
MSDGSRSLVAIERTTLASIVATSRDAIVGINAAGAVSTWNSAAVGLYGYAPEKIIGQSVDVLTPLKRRAEEAAILHRVMAGEHVAPYRCVRVRLDGTAVPVLVTVSLVVDPAGTMAEAVTTSHQINEALDDPDHGEALPGDVETRLSRPSIANDQVQHAGDAFQDRMGTARAQERVHVQDAQDRFQDRMGSARAQERVHVQDAQDRFQNRMGSARAQERVQVQDAQDRFQVGMEFERAKERVHVQQAQDKFEKGMDADLAVERVQVQDAQDRFQEGMGVERAKERVQVQEAQDRFQEGMDSELARAVRDRDDLLAQSQQSQRMEVLGQLAGGVAHDFNNLLAVILNYAAFVAEELVAGPASDWETAGRDVGQIQRAAERASALTHQLLAFARREVIQHRVLDLNDVVRDVEQLLNRTIGEDVLLSVDLAQDLWPVLADAGQIEQVLVNLAINARDAMNGGGTLSIDTANMTMDADFAAHGSSAPGVRHIRLRVSDTGTGMTPDVLAHVFEPFYTNKPDGTGTGLGLSTVYGIVAQTEATIAIQSEPGIGTTFTIVVPVTDETGTPIEESSTYQHVPTGETVLIVEDQEALRQVTERIFIRGGYRVLTAADGLDALALVAAHHGEIHLLVTDVVMPNMLGKEVAEKIQHSRPDIKVLFMSGYAQPVLASQGKLDPDVNLIEKPFSAAAIIEKAGQVLNSHAHD